MEIHANLRVFAALLALHPWPAPFPWPLSISMRPLSVQQIAVCGRSIAALGRSDLSSFRNPARPIVVNAAKELEFAPLDRLALPTSAAATPRGDCHASTKIAPLVSLHPPRDLLQAKDRQDGLQSLPSVAALFRHFPVFPCQPRPAPFRSHGSAGCRPPPSRLRARSRAWRSASKRESCCALWCFPPPWCSHATQLGANAIVGTPWHQPLPLRIPCAGPPAVPCG